MTFLTPAFLIGLGALAIPEAASSADAAKDYGAVALFVCFSSF